MQVWALIRWWYGAGWLGETHRLTRRLVGVEEYFSFGNLLRTLFQPFKQIDAGSTRGGLSVQARAFLDRTISRIIGAFSRLTLLIIGVVWWIIVAAFGLIWLCLWPFFPIAPVIGIFAALIHFGGLE